MMSDEKNPPEKVGYKCPPKHSRFKAGQSGNPRGRPRGSVHFASSFRKKWMRKVPVKKNGRTQHMTVIEAVSERLVNTLLTGNMTEMLKALQAVERYMPEQLRPLPKDMNMRVTYVLPDSPNALPPPPAHLLPPEDLEDD
jgi:hypothetical protein